MTNPVTIHASTVAFDDRAVLIRGASGTGKSTLALQLIAIGARLVADDQTRLTKMNDQIVADCPGPIKRKIEARGIGILRAPTTTSAILSVVVDLNHITKQRLPDPVFTTIHDLSIPLVYHCNSAAFAASLKLYALYGRAE